MCVYILTINITHVHIYIYTHVYMYVYTCLGLKIELCIYIYIYMCVCVYKSDQLLNILNRYVNIISVNKVYLHHIIIYSLIYIA